MYKITTICLIEHQDGSFVTNEWVRTENTTFSHEANHYRALAFELGDRAMHNIDPTLEEVKRHIDWLYDSEGEWLEQRSKSGIYDHNQAVRENRVDRSQEL